MPRLALAAMTGTAIEFYDFYVYGTAAALVLGPLYFPTVSPLLGTLAAFATFGVGFLARPLGAVLFGHIGDRHGRRPVLMASLLLTGLATVAVGCVPTYESIGIAAPLLLLVLRFAQGLGLGGEWGGAVLLTAEHAPAHRRALWTSLPQLGAPTGFLLANGLALALSAGLAEADYLAWGWRVPFWGAGLMAAAGLLLRSRLPETPQFRALEATDSRAALPLAELLRGHWRPVLLTAGGLSLVFAAHYAISTWALAYGTEQLEVGRTAMLGCIMAGVVVSSLLTPFFAVLGDRYGRRSLCLAGSAGLGLWMVPLMGLLHTGRPAWMVLGFAGAAVPFAAVVGVVAAYLPELFETRVRCTGAAVGYNLAGVVGGGLTPVAATALAQGSGPPWAVAGYLGTVALVSLGCFALLPETRPAAAPGTAAEAAPA
ncbi:MFS transporter [Streptomyces aureoversilis]|uniref:MFS transporter n=1 Tax=Streptomyces aureoversilis TaxID=67277 RepID=A0ABW0A4E6_9ACTN